jgi:GDPmannose 4,6-dehydratase
MAKRALITGITGQDGGYLTELLLAKGYEVHAVVRAPLSAEREAALGGQVVQHRGDLTDQRSLVAAIAVGEPDEIYNLGAVSRVPASAAAATAAADVNALGVVRILEAMAAGGSEARFFQASSSEIFGGSGGVPQNEQAAIAPRSPYGAAKAYGHFVTGDYRRRHDLFACSGILFNHESPRRPADFVTRRVTRGAAAIKLGLADELALGNLDARRDWGYAPEYMEAAWAMLQAQEPGDYVIGSGTAHSVAELVEVAFARLGLDVERYVRADPRALRAGDEEYALADPRKALARLGWTARTGFTELIHTMVDADMAALDAAAD